MSYSISETCTCGASFKFNCDNGSVLKEEHIRFIDAHEKCREPQETVSGGSTEWSDMVRAFTGDKP